MFSLAKIQSQTDIKVSAVRPDLHIEIITGAKGKMEVGREGGREGRYFKCRGGVQTETAVQCCMQLCAGLRLNKDELVMSNLT